MVKDLEYNRKAVAKWRKLNRERYLEQHKACQIKRYYFKKESERMRNIDIDIFYFKDK